MLRDVVVCDNSKQTTTIKFGGTANAQFKYILLLYIVLVLWQNSIYKQSIWNYKSLRNRKKYYWIWDCPQDQDVFQTKSVKHSNRFDVLRSVYCDISSFHEPKQLTKQKKISFVIPWAKLAKRCEIFIYWRLGNPTVSTRTKINNAT